MTTTKDRETLTTREATVEEAPTQVPRFSRKALAGTAALVMLIVAIVVVATQGGEVGTEQDSNRALPQISVEDWAPPEMFIPQPTVRPIAAAAWVLPETSVAGAMAQAATAGWNPPEMSIAEGKTQAGIANWHPPETSVSEGEALAAIANLPNVPADDWNLPEMTVAEGIKAATNGYATSASGPR